MHVVESGGDDDAHGAHMVLVGAVRARDVAAADAATYPLAIRRVLAIMRHP